MDFKKGKNGADTQNRTGDLILTKDALYRLSHISKFGAGGGNRTRIISLEGWSNSHYTTPACIVMLVQKWWREKDSNLRRLSRQIYSLIPLATREPLHIIVLSFDFH
jgi:hypothetical protein